MAQTRDPITGQLFDVGAAHVAIYDPATGVAVPNPGGFFVPTDQGGDLTGSAANQTQAMTAGTVAVRFYVATAAARIKFGNAASAPDATAAGALLIPVGGSVLVQVPSGADRFAYTGNTAAINWVEM